MHPSYCNISDLLLVMTVDVMCFIYSS